MKQIKFNPNDPKLWKDFDPGEEAEDYVDGKTEKIVLLKKAGRELANNPEWKEKQNKGQENRKKTGWSKKMIGNKNGANPDNPRFKGKKHSDESRKKTSESMKGIVHTTLIGVPKPKETCPHCGKVGGRPQMFQYHFDRCKFK